MKDIIFQLLKKRNFTLSYLAEKMGYAGPTGVSNALNRKTAMRVDTFVKMADAMDYEIVVRSKSNKQEVVVVGVE